jgi:hypothetical protein
MTALAHSWERGTNDSHSCFNCIEIVGSRVYHPLTHWQVFSKLPHATSRSP